MLRDPIGGSRKLLSVVCSPIGGAELGHVHARGRDRQGEPTHSGWSLERDAGRDDAAHGLGHQVDGTINRDVDKPDKIVNAVDVEIMGLVAEARPAEECLSPSPGRSFATGCQNPESRRHRAGTRFFSFFDSRLFRAIRYSAFWRLVAARHAIGAIRSAFRKNTRSDLIRPRIPVFLRNQVYADCLSLSLVECSQVFSVQLPAKLNSGTRTTSLRGARAFIEDKGVSQEAEIVRTASPDKVRCTTVSDWIEYGPYLLQTPETEVYCIANGICRLLCDIQVDLSGAEFAWHSRTVQRVLTREGPNGSRISRRNSIPNINGLKWISSAYFATRKASNMQPPRPSRPSARETNLELTLNGRLTASLLIPDVRENDIVEVGLTMYGSTPVLGGRYAAWAGFDSFNPWFESRHRLRWPVSRKIFVKEYNNPPDPDVTIRDDVEDSRWLIVGQKRREAEELTPPWLVLVPALQFGELENWNEVACLFAPF
jgi:hypothetical protein